MQNKLVHSFMRDLIYFANRWTRMRSVMVIAICCVMSGGWAVLADEEMTQDGGVPLKREARGILLNSWRNIQQKQEQPAKQKPLPAVDPLMIPSSNGPMLFSNLPVSVQLALLQRLSSNEKRTPNAKAFLGMRGKKRFSVDDVASATDQSTDGDIDVNEIWGQVQMAPRKKKHVDRFMGTRGKKDPPSRFYGVRGKKIPDIFLGMRGKKNIDIIRDGLEPLLLRDEDVKRSGAATSSLVNSFVGMRGKKNAPLTQPDLGTDEYESDGSEEGQHDIRGGWKPRQQNSVQDPFALIEEGNFKYPEPL